MEIFIQSRGFSREHDYTWLKVSPEEIERAEPPQDAPKIDLTKLGDFSVLLGRENNSLYLLVWGLKSSRKDIAHRPIRNSVLWLTHDLGDEPMFRALAARALKNQILASSTGESLDQAIDKVVYEGGMCGFQTSFLDLEPQKFITLQNPDVKGKLEIQSSNQCSGGSIIKIAEELENYSLLQWGKFLSILLTRSTSKKTSDEAEIWRVVVSLPRTSNLPKASPKEQNQQNLSFLEQFFLNGMLVRTLIPSLLSVAITASIFLAFPIRGFFIEQPCPPLPNPAAVTFSGQPIWVKDPVPLTIRREDSRIKTMVLIPDNQESQKIDLGSTLKYSYPGFQTVGKHQLTLRGLDSEGRIIGEQARDYIVQNPAEISW